MNPLDLLSSLLTQATNASPVSFHQNLDIDAQLDKLRKHSKAGGRAYEPRDLQVEAVARFRSKLQFESLRDARLVSFGLGVEVPGSTGCLMEDRRLFRAALTGIDEWEEEPRQFRKCYQGLLHSYFGYDGLGRGTPDEGRENWTDLRAYLSRRAPRIVSKDLNPDWVTCARENPEVLTATPCTRLAQDIAAGREDRVKHVRAMLNIDDASWFTRELILAQIQQATKLPHTEFRNNVADLLRMLEGNEVLRDRGLQLILDRYALVPQTPQHSGLKDKSVNSWGNPWLPSNKDRWGGVNEAAKVMVSDWLKLEFIDLFFSKLAQDGIGDTRRVNFWRKYVKSIEQIHFALGSNAMYSREQDFRELRTKLKGLLVQLEEPNGANNAFIMTMGDLVAVEFSGATNAFYGYSVKQTLPFDLSKPVCTPVDGRNSLKNSSRVLYLRHQDNVQGMDWEERFATELRRRFGIAPGTTAPTRVAAQTTQQSIPPKPSSAPSPSTRWSPPPRDHRAPPIQPESVVRPTAGARPPPPAPSTPAVGLGQPQARTGVTTAETRRTTEPDAFTLSLESFLRSKVPEAKAQAAGNLPFSLEDLNAFARRIGGEVEDHRKKGGALWVKTNGMTTREASQQLKAWGFTFKAVPNPGWWIKPKA